MGDLLRALVTRSTSMAQDYAADYASNNRLYTVGIDRITGEPGFDRASGAWLDAPRTEIYAGPARITPVTGGQSDEGTDAPAFLGKVRISIDDTDGVQVRVQDVVTVAGDAVAVARNMAGRVFQVDDVEVGGQMSTGLSFTATGVEPSRWAP